jgi:hypothetical protein
VLALLQNPQNYTHSRLRIFFNVSSIIGSILVAIGLIYSTQVVEDGKNLTKTQQTLNLIERCELNPIRKMNDFYEKCPNFVVSLFPQKGLFPNAPKGVIDDDASVLQLCFEMIQAFEDHFTASKYDLTSEKAWVGTFLQWTSSQKFYEIFLKIYPNFHDQTNNYTKLLFEYSRKEKLDTVEKLEEASIKFVSDPRVKKIFEDKRKYFVKN